MLAKRGHIRHGAAPVQMGKGGDPEMVLTTLFFVPTGVAGEDFRPRAFVLATRNVV